MKVLRGHRTKDVSDNAGIYITVNTSKDIEILNTWEKWFIEKDVPFKVGYVNGKLRMVRDFEFLDCIALQNLGWRIRT